MIRPLIPLLALILSISNVFAQPNELGGTLSDNYIIVSDTLGYRLQYRVYLPPNYEDLSDLPVLYVTDGQWYIRGGAAPRILDDLIVRRKIKPIVAVFLDNRDPDNLSVNRRTRQFYCHQPYIRFFTHELIPHVDSTFSTSARREDRTILGLSFGGMNSACFGFYAHDHFEGIAMQSPAMQAVPELFVGYRDSKRLPLRIFLSTGTVADNVEQARVLKDIFEKHRYDLEYIEVPYGHNWQNWKPLLDDVFLFYYGR